MFIDKVSRHLGLTILKADMTEDDFWSMAIEAPEGFVAGWPFSNGTASFAVKSRHLKSFLAATRTRRKASSTRPSEWQTPQEEPAGLARYRRNWQ
jgi:hypothetical protein